MGSRIGWGELVIILIIALIVLGPDKLPQMGRTLGKAVRSVKKYIHEATKELDEIDEFKEIKSDVEGIQKDLKHMGEGIERSMRDDADAVAKDVRAAERDIRTAVESGPADTEAKDTTAENADMEQEV